MVFLQLSWRSPLLPSRFSPTPLAKIAGGFVPAAPPPERLSFSSDEPKIKQPPSFYASPLYPTWGCGCKRRPRAPFQHVRMRTAFIGNCFFPWLHYHLLGHVGRNTKRAGLSCEILARLPPWWWKTALRFPDSRDRERSAPPEPPETHRAASSASSGWLQPAGGPGDADSRLVANRNAPGLMAGDPRPSSPCPSRIRPVWRIPPAAPLVLVLLAGILQEETGLCLGERRASFSKGCSQRWAVTHIVSKARLNQEKQVKWHSVISNSSPSLITLSALSAGLSKYVCHRTIPAFFFFFFLWVFVSGGEPA